MGASAPQHPAVMDGQVEGGRLSGNKHKELWAAMILTPVARWSAATCGTGSAVVSDDMFGTLANTQEHNEGEGLVSG